MTINITTGTNKITTINLIESTLWERRIIECAIKQAQTQIQEMCDECQKEVNHKVTGLTAEESYKEATQ